MDIEDELPIAPASAGGGEPSLALLFGQFDVEAYAAKYSGRTRVARLLFIAENSWSEQMQLDALRLAYEGSLEGEDTALHRDVSAKIAGRLGPRYAVDQAWSDAVDRRSLVLKEKLDSDLNGYKTNLIQESIRMGYNDLGDFHYARGNLAEALECYIRTRDYCNNSKHVVHMCLNVILVSVDMGQYMHILTYVSQAEQTPDDKDPLTVAKLRAAAGLAYLENNDYRLAALKFIETGSELMENYSEVISPQDVAFYGALCALASFDRPELKSKVIDNHNFCNLLDLVPEVRKLVNDFYASRFSSCLCSLDNLKSQMLVDIHLYCHFEYLYNTIYHEATALEREIDALFAEDNVQARIDSYLRPYLSKAAASSDGTPKAEETAAHIRFGQALALMEMALLRSLRDDSTINSLHCDEPKLRDKLIREAFLGLKAKRAKAAVQCINHVAEMGPDMSLFERSLFFLSTLTSTLDGIKSLHKLLNESFGGQTAPQHAMLVRFRNKVRLEYHHACLSQIGMINKVLVPNSFGESTVCYLRLKGLIFEVLTQLDCTNANRYSALSAYMTAVEKADEQLRPSDPEALLAALDLAIFLESEMNDIDCAYEAARKALDKANPILQGSSRDPGLQPSRYYFTLLALRLSELEKQMTGKKALLPYELSFKEDDRTPSPDPEGRQCNSGGLDFSALKLPKNYAHPILAYKLRDEGEGEDDCHDLLFLSKAEDSGL